MRQEMMIKSILWLCTNILILLLKAPKHLKNNNNIFKSYYTAVYYFMHQKKTFNKKYISFFIKWCTRSGESKSKSYIYIFLS